MIDIPLLMTENDSPVFYFTSAYSALGDVYKLVTRSITRRTLLALFWCTDGDIYGNDGAATLLEIAAACAVLSFTPFYISIMPRAYAFGALHYGRVDPTGFLPFLSTRGSREDLDSASWSEAWALDVWITEEGLCMLCIGLRCS
jgi:hypothetical protein